MKLKIPNYLIISLVAMIGVVLLGCQSETNLQETLSPAALAGQKVYKNNCASCHATKGNTVIVGPSLFDIATRAETQEEGLSAREYLITSILKPSAYIVDGYKDVMPSQFGVKLSGEELDNLVKYLFTLD